jgi:RNA polymerase-binding transcription factor DksA
MLNVAPCRHKGPGYNITNDKTEVVNTMNAMQEKMFLELRLTKTEIEHSLKDNSKQDWLTKILKEELADVDEAIRKMEAGKYGECEISGELIPEDLLMLIPTIRCKKDSDLLENYYKKPISSSFL